MATNHTRRTWIICPEGDALTTLRAALTYLLGRDCSGEVVAPWGPPGGSVTHRVSSAQMTWGEVQVCLPGVSPGGAFYEAGVRAWAQVAPGVDDLPGRFVLYREGVDLNLLPETLVAIVDDVSPVPEDALHPRLRWSPDRIEADMALAGLVPWTGGLLQPRSKAGPRLLLLDHQVCSRDERMGRQRVAEAERGTQGDPPQGDRQGAAGEPLADAC